MIFGDFSKVVPAESVFTSRADGFDLQNVMRMQTEIVGSATGERVEDGLAKLEQDGTCD